MTTTPTTTPTSGMAIQRYKIGYHADEWGQRSSTPSGIPDASGSWVRYADHVTALAAGQATAAQQGVAYAALPESFLEIPDVQDESGINTYYSREVVLECIDAALASHGQAPAEVSPTAGMSIPQRILHVGGRDNAAGYVEFGSIQAVEALVRQVLRDLPSQQPAPSPAETVGNSGFDYQTAADVLNGKTVSDEAIRKFVAASRWAHDDRAGLRATLLSVRGELASREAEILLLKNALMGAEGPQPSTTAQADTQPAITPETGNPASAQSGLTDAYAGAREDLSIWKRRALEAERDLRSEKQTTSRLVGELNAANGPAYMGEPAASPAYGVTEYGWADYRRLQDGDKRLIALVVGLYGNDHQSSSDLEGLLDRASHGQAPARAPADPAGDNFGSAEHWKEKAQYWAAAAHRMRQEALRGEPVDGIVHPKADSVQEDAARYRWLTGDHHKHEVRAMVYEIATSMNTRGKGSVDAAIDAARAAQEGKSHE